MVYVVDVSGSTYNIVSGATVGDVNHDGRANTILDVEIAALQSLTDEIEALGFPDGAVSISVVSFNHNPGPRANFTLGGSVDGDNVDAFLETLRYGGGTDYVDGIRGASQSLQQLTSAYGPATNLVYFMSDGQAQNSTTQIQYEATTRLYNPFNAQVSGFGIGNNVPMQYLNALDNTGAGAERVTNPNDLGAALLGSPIPAAAIIDADVFIFNSDGVQVGAVDLDAADFTAGPLGLSVDLNGISGFDAYQGDVNRLDLEVQIDSDEDGTADFTLQASVDVQGVLPESFDFA